MERDSENVILPTLRNAETINNIFQEHQSIEKMQEALGSDFFHYVASAIFDPRQTNVFFRTRKQAAKAAVRADLINHLDQQWLANKNLMPRDLYQSNHKKI